MASSRTAVALVGLLVGLAGSVALTLALENAVVLFLFLPFVPFLFRWGRSGTSRENRGSDRGEPSVRTCPQCGFTTRDREHRYCPRDGRRLEEH